MEGLAVNLWEVPRVWPDETIVIAASGPSIIEFDLEAIRQEARLIVVNDAYKLVSSADALYACDWWWWAHNEKAFSFPAVRVGLGYNAQAESWITGWPHSKEAEKVNLLQSTGQHGLELEDRTAVRTGGNSGYQAINFAVHLGASRIILLGYDMKPSEELGSHFFGEHEGRARPPFDQFLRAFETIVEPLEEAGVSVINCTPDSALTVFRQADISEAL